MSYSILPGALPCMALQAYLLFVVLLAVALDAALIIWLKRIKKERGSNQQPGSRFVTILGSYSPILTWLRYTLPQQLMDTMTRLGWQETGEIEPDTGAMSGSCGTCLELEFDFSSANRVSFTIERRGNKVPALGDASLNAGSTAFPGDLASQQNEHAMQRIAAFARPLAAAAAHRAAWVLLVIAAGLPALLVIWDRWFETPLNIPMIGGFWEQFVRSQSISLPVYFAVVVICWLALPWLVKTLGKPMIDPAVGVQEHPPAAPGISTRRMRIANLVMAAAVICAVLVFLLEIANGQRFGVFYLAALFVFVLAAYVREYRLADTLQAARRHWKPAAIMALLHILLVQLLYHVYGDRRYVWLWFLLLAGALLILFRSSTRLPRIYWLANFALVLFVIRIDGWEYSVIGDEFSFFSYAQELARSRDWLTILNQLFDGTAVYGSHPFFSSVIQALFARIFSGSSNFGWRISNLYLSALSLILLYHFFKQFLPARLSLLAVSLLAPAHYLMTFGKIGYNNLQALFAAALVLAAGAWAVRRQSYFSLTVFGLAAGLCFYVYPAALYILPVAALLMLFYAPPITPPALRRWLTVGLPLALLLLPLLVQTDYWREKMPGTMLYQPDIVSSPASLGSHFASNLLYSSVSFLFIPQESHFVVVSYLDALTGSFFILGCVVLLLAGWKDRFWAFLITSFLILLLLVGTSHGGRYPPTTRMFMLLPFWALIAALGMAWALEQLYGLPRFPRYLYAWLPALMLLVVLGLNLYQAYVLSPRRSIGYQSPVMLFVRILEHLRGRSADGSQNLVFAFLTSPPWGIDGYALMLSSYDVPADQVRLEKIDVFQNELPVDKMELLRSPRTLVIIYPDMDASIQSALVEPVRALGKLPCPVRTLSGVTRFSLWISPTMEWICAAGE